MEAINQSHDVYEAIANSTRRELIRLLAQKSELSLHELTYEFQISRTAVTKHLTILKSSNLVITRKVGRETRYQLNAEPLKEVQNWLSYYENFWNNKIQSLQNLLQDE